MKLSIATATIVGLEMKPHKQSGGFGWDLSFCRQTAVFNHISFSNIGANVEEAEEFCLPIKEQFAKAQIAAYDKVVILFETETGNARAIGSIGSEKWIDVQDKFALKTFEELNINITSLKVY